MSEFAMRFGTSPARAILLKGLISYRAALRAVGIVSGYQWLNGSFCEDIETIETRPPNDIDVVTTFIRPVGHQTDADWVTFFAANNNLFDEDHVKGAWGCHPFFIDAHLPLGMTIRQVTYWFGLFTHQRVTFQWKGMVQVDLNSDDAAAIAHIDSLGFPP